MTLCLVLGVIAIALIVTVVWVERELPSDPVEHDESEDTRSVCVTVKAPESASDRIVARLTLSSTQRQVLLEKYDALYGDNGLSPDIKLESFVETVRNARSTEAVPVFYWQRVKIVLFARSQGLPWLSDMLLVDGDPS